MHSLSPIARRAQLGLRFLDEPPANPEGGTPPPSGGAPAQTDPPKPEDKGLSQAEVSRIAAREKAEGRQAAERDLATQLGVSLDEAKSIIEKHKADDEATKTEAQKDRDKAAVEKAEAENERAAARKETHDARLERAFDKVGVDLGDKKEQEKNLRLLRLVTAEVGASYDDILAEVKQIQTDFPGLFGTAEPPKTKIGGAPNGDPKGTPSRPTPGEGSFDTGRKRAQARYAQPEGAKENPLLAAARKS